MHASLHRRGIFVPPSQVLDSLQRCSHCLSLPNQSPARPLPCKMGVSLCPMDDYRQVDRGARQLPKNVDACHYLVQILVVKVPVFVTKHVCAGESVRRSSRANE